MGRRGAAGYVVRPPNTCPPGRRDSVAHAPDTKSPRTTRTTTRQDLVRAARNPLDDSALPLRDRSRSREDPELLEASTTARCILTCRHGKLDPDAGWSRSRRGRSPAAWPRVGRTLLLPENPEAARRPPAHDRSQCPRWPGRFLQRGHAPRYGARPATGSGRDSPASVDAALTSVAREYADPRSAGSFGHNTWSRNTSAAAT